MDIWKPDEEFLDFLVQELEQRGEDIHSGMRISVDPEDAGVQVGTTYKEFIDKMRIGEDWFFRSVYKQVYASKRREFEAYKKSMAE